MKKKRNKLVPAAATAGVEVTYRICQSDIPLRISVSRVQREQRNYLRDCLYLTAICMQLATRNITIVTPPVFSNTDAT